MSSSLTAQWVSMCLPSFPCRWIRTWALDVADDRTGSVVHELDAHLCDTTTGACKLSALCPSLCNQYFGDCSMIRTSTAKDTGDLDELDGDLCGFHFGRCVLTEESWGLTLNS